MDEWLVLYLHSVSKWVWGCQSQVWGRRCLVCNGGLGLGRNLDVPSEWICRASLSSEAVFFGYESRYHAVSSKRAALGVPIKMFEYAVVWYATVDLSLVEGCI